MKIFFNDETQNQNLLIPRQKPNRFFHTGVIFPFWNQRLLNSRLFYSMIHVCARFCSVVLSGFSKPQAK